MNDSTEKGLYVACKYDRSSVIKIKQLCKMLNLDAPDSDDIHTTICYSRKPPSKPIDYATLPINHPASAKIIGLQVFNGRDGSKILVVMLESNFLTEQHNHYMAEYDLSYDFDQYRPHVTLSYDYNSDNAPSLPNGIDLQLVINSIYTEPLDTSWNVK